MKVGLGRRLSQKTLAMQRCFREGGLVEKMYTQLQVARDSVRQDQARLANNMLSELRWHTLPPLLKSDIPEAEKKMLRRMVKEVKGASGLILEKSNHLEPLDAREKEEFRQRVDHLLFHAQQHAGFAMERCGGSPGYR